jgi:agmatinase
VQFLGLTGSNTAYETAPVVILPIPYEYSVTFGRGTGRGPRAVLDVSPQLEEYDEFFGAETWRPSLHTAERQTVDGPPERLAERLAPAVGAVMDHGKIPICLGGEHSLTFGAVAAARERYPGLTVLSLDAHPDLRDRYTELSLGHATVMRRVSELCPVTIAGVRGISAEEVAFLAEGDDRPTVHYRNEHRPLSAHAADVARTLSRHVYLSIDVDVLDPGVLPATGTPEPDGLSWQELNGFLDTITADHTIVGADVVEFAPPPGDHTWSFVVARLVYRLVGFLRRSVPRLGP